MKTTTKRVFSLFLTLVMALGLCTVGTFAHVINGTITAYASGSSTPLGTYGSITEAANAAGTNGRVVLSAGTFEFDYRQIIAVDGLTLEGAGIDSTTVITSSSYASAGTSDRKALLTLTGTGVTVKNLTVDGGTYGSTLVPTGDEGTMFNVVRVNSGSATLQNVKIKNSKRTLLSVGMSTTTASVVGQGLVLEGMDKTIDTVNTYADVNIVYGSLTLDADCVVDAFISKDPGNNNAKTLTADSSLGLYTLGCPYTFWIFTFYGDSTSTIKHFMHAYTLCTTDEAKSTFVKLFDHQANQSVLDDMVWATIDSLEDGATSEELTIANQMLAALDYARVQYSSNTTIAGWYSDLADAISSVQS